jgi:hypothetical protein
MAFLAGHRQADARHPLAKTAHEVVIGTGFAEKQCLLPKFIC